jgi:type IV pilus assembly protein PilE
MLKRNKRGFTLIELLIVIAIVSILVGVAYPSYQEHILRSRRSECTTVIVSLANALERRYSTTAPATYIAAPVLPAGFNATCPQNPGAGGPYYNLALPVLTATTFTIQAAPVGNQAKDKCGGLTLTQAGVKDIDQSLATGSPPAVTPQQCW